MEIALVTGARRGIGKAIAEALLKSGMHVIACGTASEASLTEGIEYKKCDITNKQDVINLRDYIKDKYNRLDLLVNNAGVAPLERKDILEMNEESFDRVLNTNLKGTFFMCQTFSKFMIDLKGAYTKRIINISSVSAYTSSTSRGEYCISKAGISMVTALFADRMAEFDIPVFEVRPGIIRTDMTKVVTEKYEKSIAEGLTPIKRMGEPEDVAKCVLALASGLMDFSTGQVINADGGFSIRRL